MKEKIKKYFKLLKEKIKSNKFQFIILLVLVFVLIFMSCCRSCSKNSVDNLYNSSLVQESLMKRKESKKVSSFTNEELINIINPLNNSLSLYIDNEESDLFQKDLFNDLYSCYESQSLEENLFYTNEFTLQFRNYNIGDIGAYKYQIETFNNIYQIKTYRYNNFGFKILLETFDVNNANKIIVPSQSFYILEIILSSDNLNNRKLFTITDYTSLIVAQHYEELEHNYNELNNDYESLQNQYTSLTTLFNDYQNSVNSEYHGLTYQQIFNNGVFRGQIESQSIDLGGVMESIIKAPIDFISNTLDFTIPGTNINLFFIFKLLFTIAIIGIVFKLLV